MAGITAGERFAIYFDQMFGRFKKTRLDPSDMPADAPPDLAQKLQHPSNESSTKTPYQILLGSLAEAAQEVEHWPAYKRGYDFIIQR